MNLRRAKSPQPESVPRSAIPRKPTPHPRLISLSWRAQGINQERISIPKWKCLISIAFECWTHLGWAHKLLLCIPSYGSVCKWYEWMIVRLIVFVLFVVCIYWWDSMMLLCLQSMFSASRIPRSYSPRSQLQAVKEAMWTCCQTQSTSNLNPAHKKELKRRSRGGFVRRRFHLKNKHRDQVAWVKPFEHIYIFE